MRAARPRILGLLAAVLVLGVGAAPSSSAAGAGITVSAGTTGWVDVTVHESGEIAEDSVTITTNGRFGGFVLVPDTTTRPVVGAVWLPRVGADGESGRLVAIGDWEVYAGRYRLYVLGEAQTTVFVPLPGSGHRAYTARHRTGLAYRQIDFTAAAQMSATEWREPLALTARRGTVVVAAAKVRSSGVDQALACVTTANTSCSEPVVPTVSGPFVDGRTAVTAVQPPGRYDAVLNVTHGPVVGDATVAGALLVLPLLV